MTLQYCSDRVSEESASLSQNASSCDVCRGVLQASGRRGWTPQYVHYRETTPTCKLYMMPGSRSSDPDPVWIRIRPDPKCQDPAWIRIRPDLKILDPVHPVFSGPIT